MSHVRETMDEMLVTVRLPKKVKIEVTQDIIDEAVPRSCQLCIGGLAFARSVPSKNRKVQLNLVTLRREGSPYRERAVLPRLMNDALIKLDTGRRDEIKPFSFWAMFERIGPKDRGTNPKELSEEEKEERRRKARERDVARRKAYADYQAATEAKGEKPVPYHEWKKTPRIHGIQVPRTITEQDLDDIII
jgi:hypothetical protein